MKNTSKKGAAAIQYILHFLFSILIPVVIFLALFQITTRVGTDDAFHMPAITKDVANTLETVASFQGDVLFLYKFENDVQANYSDGKLILQRKKDGRVGQQLTRDLFIPKYLDVKTQTNFSKSYVIGKQDSRLYFLPIVDTNLGNTFLNCTKDEVLNFTITTNHPSYKLLEKNGTILFDIKVQKHSAQMQNEGVIVLVGSQLENKDVVCRLKRAFMQDRTPFPTIVLVEGNDINFILANELSLLPIRIANIVRIMEVQS
jgi:hypothetical protein